MVLVACCTHPTKGETATEGGAAGTPWRWGARATRRSSRRNSVHECPKTAPRGHFHRSVYTPVAPPARATGRGHGPHDIDGPMVPVMPWGSDLRPRHQGGDATTYTNSRTWHHLIWEIWAGSSA